MTIPKYIFIKKSENISERVMAENLEEDDDDEDELLMVMNLIRVRKRNRARHSKLLPKLLKILYGDNRGDNRLAMTGFTELVWRYQTYSFLKTFE